MRNLPRKSGFTLIETSVSVAVLGVLLTSAFSITLETMSFWGDNETDTALQSEAHRTLERLTDLLRKSGRTRIDGIEYPRVIAGGQGLQFAMLTDLDGNGYAFDSGTSALEWSNVIYTVRRNSEGSVQVYRGLDPVYYLGRFVQTVGFRTVRENPTLNIKEIQVALDFVRATKSGASLTYFVNGSIHMRN
jgi:prepilin-type N-terminal cleavage/methylation domain-containing protein